MEGNVPYKDRQGLKKFKKPGEQREKAAPQKDEGKMGD